MIVLFLFFLSPRSWTSFAAGPRMTSPRAGSGESGTTAAMWPLTCSCFGLNRCELFSAFWWIPFASRVSMDAAIFALCSAALTACNESCPELGLSPQTTGCGRGRFGKPSQYCCTFRYRSFPKMGPARAAARRAGFRGTRYLRWRHAASLRSFRGPYSRSCRRRCSASWSRGFPPTNRSRRS